MDEIVASAVLESIVEFLVAPIRRQFTPIGRQFRYIFCYNNNIANLRDEAKNLEDVKDGVQRFVDANRKNLEVIGPDVQFWLTNVENIKVDLDRIFKDKNDVDKGCLNGWCMNPKSRYLLSRKALNKAEIIRCLQSKGKQFTKFSCPALLDGIAASTSTGGSKGFLSRMKIMKEITDALKNDTIALIGICGEEGIGKTTMVKEIAKREISEKNFDKFAITVVSQNKDIVKIQGQLAGMMDLSLPEQENVQARAQYLHEGLMHGGRILVILDDVWEALDMGEIGIPFGDNRRECKVVFTSQKEEVCKQMSDQTFTIGRLYDEEAWDLFKETAGKCVESRDIRPLAREVVKKCEGLPLEIVTWGKKLRNRKVNAWISAIQQQRKSSMTNITRTDTEASTRESNYNGLEKDEAKSLFRLCCWFPKDEVIPIEMLIRYSVGLHLFKDGKELVQARKTVAQLVEELTRSKLLVADPEGFVKVPDVARNVGQDKLNAQGEGNAYLLLHDTGSSDVGRDKLNLQGEGNAYLLLHDTGSNEISENDKYESYTTVSIYSKEMHVLPDCLDTAKLKLLSFECGHDDLEISRDFFAGMEYLQVIDFRINIVESLPRSLRFLRNLRTLCLDFCSLGDISLIGGLRSLEILSFFRSEIRVLPSKIRQLKKLKLLDLRCTRGPTLIPAGVLSGLKGLEELYTGNYFDPRNVVEDNQRKSANASELNSLSCLKALHISIKRATPLELKSLSRLKALQISITLDNEFFKDFKNFQFQNLEGFDFSTFDVDSLPFPQYHFSNSVALSGVDMCKVLGNVNQLRNVNQLMRRTERLSLEGGSDSTNRYCIELDKNVFVNLKRLNMSDCQEVRYVIDGVCSDQDNVISNLESLHIAEIYNLTEICNGDLPLGSFGRLQEMSLMRLPNMRHLWRGQIQLPSLGNLRVLKMSNCDAITSLFPSSAVNCLVQLEELRISMCRRLKEVVSNETVERKEYTIKMEFPKLKRLSLSWLADFRSFYSKPNVNRGSDDISDTAEPVFNQQVSLANVEVLGVIGLNIRVLISGDQMQAWSLNNLQALQVFGCVPLVAVFDFEKLQLGGELEKVMFNGLKKINLYSLPVLTHIWRNVPKGIQGFRNLTRLNVSRCGMTYLLSISMAKMLVSLQDLKITNCESMQEVIGMEEEDSSTVEMMDKMVLPELRVLELEDLERLQMFYYGKHDFELPLMDEMFIRSCPNLKTFCSGQLTAPKLERVHVKGHNLDKWVWKGDLNKTIEFVREKGKDIKMHKTASR